jgi:hypothetical protein
MPPGSKMLGIRPKSAPLLIREPSVKKASGSAQKQFGYFDLRCHILCAYAAEYGSFILAMPPIMIVIL